jgi:hypothetical protein
MWLRAALGVPGRALQGLFVHLPVAATCTVWREGIKEINAAGGLLILQGTLFLASAAFFFAGKGPPRRAGRVLTSLWEGAASGRGAVGGLRPSWGAMSFCRSRPGHPFYLKCAALLCLLRQASTSIAVPGGSEATS